jgi:hypothetical protein
MSFHEFGSGLVAHTSGFLAKPNQVDLYQVQLQAGDQVSVAVSTQSPASGLQSVLRAFDSTGKQVALDDQEGGDPTLAFQAAQTGAYFVGVSSAGDDAYDPTRAGSGHDGTSTGVFSLDLRSVPAWPAADLAGEAFRLSTPTMALGDTVSGSFTVENRGGASTSGFAVRVELASNNRFDASSNLQTLPTVSQQIAPTSLQPGQVYSTSFTVSFPATLPPGFPESGPVYLGLVLTPGSNDTGRYDKGGVHRGEDYEIPTLVVQAPQGLTNLSAVDPSLNTRINGAISQPGQVATYRLTVPAGGEFTATSTEGEGSTLAPRLTLAAGPSGAVLVQSDSGSLMQNLPAGTYYLLVSAQAGVGSYRLSSTFVQGSFPLAPLPVGSYPCSVAVADLNGDGIPDIVVANQSSNTVSVLLGNGDGTFQTEQTFSVGAYPASVAVADLNGDGKPDLVVANRGSPINPGNSVSVLLGIGDGSFRPQHTYAAGEQPDVVAVADLNGDGIPDLVVTNAGVFPNAEGTVSVLLGNGDGTFQTQQTFALGTEPISVAVADLNGDGIPDLAVVEAYSSHNPGRVSVLLGNGDGTFQTQHTYAVSSYPVSVTVADLTGDGIPDLVVANHGPYAQPGSVSVLLGKGDGTFQPQHTYAVGTDPVAVVVADLNGDGKPDIVVGNEGGPFKPANSVSVLLGNGTGTFESQQTFAVGNTLDSVAVADLNGDGSPDIVVTNRGSFSNPANSASVLLGNGDGSFQTQQTYSVGSYPASVAVADLNGDGKPELVVANERSNSVSVLLGSGDGSFQPQYTFSVGSYPYSVGVADLNGDGVPDIVVANRGSSFHPDDSVSVLLGNGDGSFQSQRTYTVGPEPDSVAVADLNGDGIPDIVVADEYDDAVSVLLGNGDGSFQLPYTYSVGSFPASVTVADLNGDGKLDLVVANDINTVSVLLGNGDGSFQAQKNYAIGSFPSSVVVADLNADGKPDIIVANRNSSTVSVLLGNGDGSFQAQQTYAVGAFPASLAVADLNGDRIPDLVVANANSYPYPGTVSVLLGNGDGSFQAQQTFSRGADPGSVAVADLNGDGIPDLVVANRGSVFDPGNSVSVLLGNAQGKFTASTPANGVELRNTPFQADLTGTGIPDTVVLDRSGNILFRQELPHKDAFAPPVILNPRRPARDLTVFAAASGEVVAAADAHFDPTLAGPADPFVYTISLYSVAADGSVIRRTAFPTSLLPTRITVGDLTGNSLDDIVVADSLNNSILVAFQNPDGSFTHILTLTTGIAPSDIALADLTGDGRIDIVVTDQATGQVTVFLNDPTHSFSTSYTFDAGTGPSLPGTTSLEQSVSLATGNFTGSGHTDLVVVNRGSHSFSVLPGDGHGGLNPSPEYTFSTSDGLAVNEQPGPVVAGDFNRDGHDDLAILMEDTGEVWIFTNDGQGHFTHTFTLPVGSGATGLAVARDPTTGFLDLLVGNQFGDVLYLLGNGNDTFSFPGSRVSLDVQTTAAGKPVVLVVNQATGQVTVQTSTQNVSFSTASTLDNGSGTTLSPDAGQLFHPQANSPDLDAVVLAAGSDRVLIYQGTGFDSAGNPTFQPTPTAYFVGDDPVNVTIAYLNGDGQPPDVLVADYGSNDVSVLLGGFNAGGDYVLTPGPRLHSGGIGPTGVTVVPDAKSVTGNALQVTNAGSADVAVLPGTGQGTFNAVNPQTFNLVPSGNPGINGVPVVVPVSGGGSVPARVLLTTDTGAVLAYNPSNLAAGAVTLFAPPAAEAVQAVAQVSTGNLSGDLVVAMSGGTVELLQPTTTGTFVPVPNESFQLTANTNLPTNPSDLQILPGSTAGSLEVVVSNAGSNLLFVFALETTTANPLTVPLPGPGEETQGTPPPSHDLGNSSPSDTIEAIENPGTPEPTGLPDNAANPNTPVASPLPDTTAPTVVAQFTTPGTQGNLPPAFNPMDEALPIPPVVPESGENLRLTETGPTAAAPGPSGPNQTASAPAFTLVVALLASPLPDSESSPSAPAETGISVTATNAPLGVPAVALHGGEGDAERAVFATEASPPCEFGLIPDEELKGFRLEPEESQPLLPDEFPLISTPAAEFPEQVFPTASRDLPSVPNLPSPLPVEDSAVVLTPPETRPFVAESNRFHPETLSDAVFVLPSAEWGVERLWLPVLGAAFLLRDSLRDPKSKETNLSRR